MVGQADTERARSDKKNDPGPEFPSLEAFMYYVLPPPPPHYPGQVLYMYVYKHVQTARVTDIRGREVSSWEKKEDASGGGRGGG